MAKLETSGHEKYQMGLEWAIIRPWEINSLGVKTTGRG